MKLTVILEYNFTTKKIIIVDPDCWISSLIIFFSCKILRLW